MLNDVVINSDVHVVKDVERILFIEVRLENKIKHKKSNHTEQTMLLVLMLQ